MSDKNELLDVYLYLPWVAYLGLPADLGINSFSFIFPFSILLLFLFFFFFDLALQARLFTMALGFLVLLMAWCPNSTRVFVVFFGLLMVNLSSRIFIFVHKKGLHKIASTSMSSFTHPQRRVTWHQSLGPWPGSQPRDEPILLENGSQCFPNINKDKQLDGMNKAG